jgi:hypothetical protein
MKLNKTLLNQIKIEEVPSNQIKLINPQTGTVESLVTISKSVRVTLKDHLINIFVQCGYSDTTKTYITVDTRLDMRKEINVNELAALFHAVKEQVEIHKHDFDNMDDMQVREEADKRLVIRNAVLREEQAYEKKLVNAEIKRIAKENVDNRIPPITSFIPNSNVKLIDKGE